MCVIFFLLGVFLSVFEQMRTGVGQPARKKSGTGKKERERSKKKCLRQRVRHVKKLKISL